MFTSDVILQRHETACGLRSRHHFFLIFISYFSNQVLGKNETLLCIFVLYPVKLLQLNNFPSQFYTMHNLHNVYILLGNGIVVFLSHFICKKWWFTASQFHIWYSADNSVLIHYITTLIFTLTGWVFDIPRTIRTIIPEPFRVVRKRKEGLEFGLGWEKYSHS